ncbi:putative rhomboid protease [Dispira simplex]|nr:putative rhomboid protease [Dispira simplex]
MSSNIQDAVRNEVRSVPGRLGRFFQRLPVVTYSVAAVSGVVFLVDLVLTILLQNHPLARAFGLAPSKVFQAQLWRLLTYPLVHYGIFHILFNLMVLLPLSTTAEKRVGSVQYVYMLGVLFTFLPGILYASLIHLVFRSSETHVASGTSGWVFALIAWECCRVEGPRSFLGLFQISSQLFPPVLLVLTELLFPQSSFFGHVACMAFGYLYAYGKLNALIPSTEWFNRMQDRAPFCWMTASPRFIDINDAQDTGSFLPVFFDPSTTTTSTTLGGPQPSAPTASRQHYVTIADVEEDGFPPYSPPAVEGAGPQSGSPSDKQPLFPGKGQRLDHQ